MSQGTRTKAESRRKPISMMGSTLHWSKGKNRFPSIKNNGEVWNWKSVKRDDEKSSPNNNGDLRKPSSNIGGEIRHYSLIKPDNDHIKLPDKVADNFPRTRGTGEDRIPSQYSTGRVETASLSLDDDPIPCQKKNVENQIPAKNSDDEQSPSPYKNDEEGIIQKQDISR